MTHRPPSSSPPELGPPRAGRASDDATEPNPTLDADAAQRVLDRRSKPAAIFDTFVERANRDWVASVEAVLSSSEADAEDLTTVRAPVVLLTQKKTSPPPAPKPASSESEWKSVVEPRSETTQRREAARLVPRVAEIAAAPPPLREGSEDGLMPSGELDRKLSDMDVLLRYGHAGQVQATLEQLRQQYPGDLLLLRRIAELYVTHSMRAPALDALFTLASGLFERRNVEGMRQALQQVWQLDPGNARAKRLLALLEQKP
jgi:hypothetical protein